MLDKEDKEVHILTYEYKKKITELKDELAIDKSKILNLTRWRNEATIETHSCADELEGIAEGLVGCSIDFYSSTRQVVQLKNIARRLRGEDEND